MSGPTSIPAAFDTEAAGSFILDLSLLPESHPIRQRGRVLRPCAREAQLLADLLEAIYPRLTYALWRCGGSGCTDGCPDCSGHQEG